MTRPQAVAVYSMVPVVAFAVAAGIAEALDGEPTSVAGTINVSAAAALAFVAPFAALAIWPSRPGCQRVAVVASLSLLAAALGAFIAASTLYDAGQAILLYPIVFGPIALAAAGIGSLLGYLGSLVRQAW